ncbi:hypothetical protein [Rhizobium sp. Rhizsp42]|uniref:hypothetical protein n=1 Tax=Rhizobium sp. Rhizsp42 TaxID=3243034 RepID=UPI0039B063D2
MAENVVMLNPDFNKALRILLEIGANQFRSTTSMEQLRAIDGLAASDVDQIVERLEFAELLTGDTKGYRLRRSIRKISLSEIYVAVIPARELPRTTFDELYGIIAHQAHEAAIRELGGLDLSSTLAEWIGTPSRKAPRRVGGRG